METIVIIVIVIVIVIVFFNINSSSKKEGFGGPVKNLQRIPKTTCYGICGQHWNRCMNEFGHVDASLCHVRYHACKNVCTYSNYQRV